VQGFLFAERALRAEDLDQETHMSPTQATDFDCLCLCPVGADGYPAIAVAAARAGGTGILDLEYCGDQELAGRALRAALEATSGQVGLRITPRGLNHAADLAGELSGRAATVIVARWEPEDVQQVHDALAPVPGLRLLFEVTGEDQLDLLPDATGVVAKGHESGGWVGEDTTFVLLQKVVKRASGPVYAQGGIGEHTAAACRVAGAAGVVLGEQLLAMPESFVAPEHLGVLSGLTGQEAQLIGERVTPLRVLVRPGFAVAERLREVAEAIEVEIDVDSAPRAASSLFHERADGLIGWGDPRETAWPAGQAIAFASLLRDRFKTTGRLVRALMTGSDESVRRAAELAPLGRGSALAKSHGTRYPIVQGPMTRVSDTAEFARSVAVAGGLPMIALAMMREAQAEKLLTKTRSLLGDRPWGVGILGFVSQALREQQLKVIRKIKPPFALIAGGRPDQAASLEGEGIATYIHVPSPQLLRMFVDQGARRFVFEGRECGGHIGPLSSFVLWEQMVEVLLREVPDAECERTHVLFAGGIHDALSAAMVATLAEPVARRGIRIGVLMGTAYLFTREAVAGGAILEGFQKQALKCVHTANLETGPGHSTRCAVTPFVREFYGKRRDMLREGRSGDEIREVLEDMNLGRLRMASKGVKRDDGGVLVSIDENQQLADGMYMIGQVATLHESVQGIEELHADVSVAGSELLAGRAPMRVEEVRRQTPSDVAIIGIGTLLPGASSAEQYWQNLLAMKSALGEIPARRWDWRLYFDADRRARDRIYSRWGGFIDEVEFDPVRYGIPPNSLKSIDPIQLLGLEVVRRALEDAGYAQGGLDNENTSVILGAGGGLGDLGLQYGTRAEMLRFAELLGEDVWDRLPEWTEESFAGALLNVIAGRIANRFNFGGSNFTVDAACASSLAALNAAVMELETGRANVAIAGGVDTIQSPFAYLCFSKTQALSPRGQARTFDKNGDGIVISEGLAVVVLKRLADAERDGDRIYGVIKAVASSSDGRALGLTAPLPAGQRRALRRAYRKAGFSPSTVGMIEAHGTGTVVGDRAEAETVVTTLRESGAAPAACAIGSVKTLIGHTKATAGIAGLIKATLALHHRVVPSHFGVDNPIDALAAEDSPVFIADVPRPWVRNPAFPRRAGVSAFGFGGTNFHVVLEEYNDRRAGAQPPGGYGWPSELFVFSGANAAAVDGQVARVLDGLASGSQPRLRDLSRACIAQAAAATAGAVSISFAADDLAELQTILAGVRRHFESPDAVPLPPGVARGNRDAGRDARVAFLFPGQGSQYLNMGREATAYLEEIREALELADERLSSSYDRPLSRYIMPPAAFSDERREHERLALTDTHVAQPAIGALSMGMVGFLDRLGLRADVVAGHSYGEYVALFAAGVLGEDAFLRLSEKRGRVMNEVCTQGDAGGMAAVQAERAQVEALLRDFENVVIANHNAPLQCVVSGPASDVEAFAARVKNENINSRVLPVAGAFHSPLVAAAQGPLAGAIAEAAPGAPRIPVYANSNGEPYPSAPQAVAEQLSGHIVGRVEFVTQIRSMYRDGARIFVEVGPGRVLGGLAGRILEGQDATIVSLDPAQGSLKGVLGAIGAVFCAGARIDLVRLFDGRDTRQLDVRALLAQSVPPAPSKTAWLLSGGSIRRPQDAPGLTGVLPPLNVDSLPEARKKLIASVAPPPAPAAPVAPSVPGAPVAPGASIPALPEDWRQAYGSYQQTMREFLKLQEQVMNRYLGGEGGPLPVAPPLPAGAVAPPAPMPALARPVPAPVETPPRAQTAPAVPVAPVAAPPAPVAAPAPGLDRAGLTALVLELVSERTGYPADMLGLDQDIEAELGIDSIKRVEVLGALQKRLPGAAAQAVQSRMDELTRAKTLNVLVDSVLAASGGAVSAPAAPVIPAAAPVAASAPGLDRAGLTALVLELVSERTGYPAEMLGVDQDIEAELGIDSIKRVEVLGALQKRLPGAAAQAVQSRMDELTRAKTLNVLVDSVLAASGGAPVAPGAPVVEIDEPAPDLLETATAAPRFTIHARTAALRPGHEAMALGGLVLVTDDDFGIAPQIVRLLRAAGCSVGRIQAKQLASTPALLKLIEKYRAEHGPVRGIVHLAPVAGKSRVEHLTAWRAAAARDVKALFDMVQGCAADLVQDSASGGAFVLSAAAFGGTFGRGRYDEAALATAGGAAGLLKCLAAEAPSIRCKVVDLDTGMAADVLAQELFDELVSSARIEVGYPSGERTVFDTVLSPFALNEAKQRLAPGPDWVVLVTGGARGITASIARDMAVCGTTLILAGRSELPEREDEQTAGIDDAAELRRRFTEAARSQGLSPTPAFIESQLRGLRRDREIRENIELLREAGAKEVRYRSLDVRDETRLKQGLDEIYQEFGRIDAVLHGAGIIEDKLIADKTRESFDRVFDTKVDSGFLLARYLHPEKLKLLVFFASVAGRYGNRGQSDYAAANEVVNRLAWRLAGQWRDTRVVSINWGPWDTTGMASEEVKRQFRERGIVPIPIVSGRKVFEQEVHFGMRGDVEVVAGEGPWAELEQAVDDATGRADEECTGCSFVRTGDLVEEKGALVLNHRFTPRSDPYLVDHTIDGKPVLPMAGAVEWFASVAQAGWSDWTVCEVRDLRVLKGVVIPEGGVDVQIRARASSHADAESLSVGMEMVDAASGRAFYKGTVVLRPALRESEQVAPSPLAGAEAVDPARAYGEYLFHTGRFVLIREIEHVADEGADARVVSTDPDGWTSFATHREWLFDPGLVDAAPQLAIVWSRARHGTTALPTRFGSVERFGTTRPGEPLALYVRVSSFEGGAALVYDALLVDEQGKVRVSMSDIESSCSTSLNRIAVNT